MARKDQVPQVNKTFQEFKPKTPNQHDFIRSIAENEITIVVGHAGTGKAQPLDSTIYTVNGPKLMGDINIGEYICTPDGSCSMVIGIYPQGIQPVYKITFSDGSNVESTLDHLWCVENRSSANKNYTLTLSEIIDKQSSQQSDIFGIMTSKPSFFLTQELELDPYLLGVLIGDGCLTDKKVSFTSIDSEIINKVTNIIQFYESRLTKNKTNYNIIKSNNGTGKSKIFYLIEKLGLSNKKSYEKFIPKHYLYNSIENRISLLQGLMDTDGSITTGGTIEYTTTSKQLSLDIKELIESLGGICRIVERQTSFTYLGKKKLGRISYRIYIKFDNEIIPFQLSRKKDRLHIKEKYFNKRMIRKIEYVGDKNCQCIKILNSNGLYLTNNYITTHNTFLSTYLACEYLLYRKVEQIVITRPAVDTGRSIGYSPGTIEEKMMAYIYPVLAVTEEVFGKEKSLALRKENKIKIVPLTYMRGYTFNKTFVIADEMSNASFEEMKLLLTRIGKDSKMVINGDLKQSDLFKDQQGALQNCLDKLHDIKGIGIVRLYSQDIQRNPIIKDILAKW